MIQKHIVYIQLGSNVGQRAIHLNTAIEYISNLGEITQVSSIYETAAWGNTNQASFLNQIIEVETLVLPLKLMRELLEIENKMGRVRTQHWEPRMIDLDILLYDDYHIQHAQLEVPHPRMHERKFVLIPLLELNPDIKHPIFFQSIRELNNWCQDDLEVKKYHGN